jgi:pilus assembly protein TadC
MAPSDRPASRAGTHDDGLPESVSSSWELLIAYTKQETVEPLKGIGKRIGLGMLGALVAGIGVIELILALLRGLQGVESFTGSLSWIPYVITFVVVVLATAIVFKIIDGRRATA